MGNLVARWDWQVVCHALIIGYGDPTVKSQFPLPPSFFVTVAVDGILVQGEGGSSVHFPRAQINRLVKDAEVAEVTSRVRIPLVLHRPALIDLPGAPTPFELSAARIIAVVGASWLAGAMVDVATRFAPRQAVKVLKLVLGETGGSSERNQVRTLWRERQRRECCCGGRWNGRRRGGRRRGRSGGDGCGWGWGRGRGWSFGESDPAGR